MFQMYTALLIQSVAMPLTPLNWQHLHSTFGALPSQIQAPRSSSMPLRRIHVRRNENVDPEAEKEVGNRHESPRNASSVENYQHTITPKRRKIIDDDDSIWAQPALSEPTTARAMPSDTEDPNFAVVLLPEGLRRQPATVQSETVRTRRNQHQTSADRRRKPPSATRQPAVERQPQENRDTIHVFLFLN